MNPHPFLITYIWDVLNVNANRMILFLRNIQRCSNHEYLLEELKNYRGGKNLTHKLSRGPTRWKDMLQNALRDIASWQTKRHSSFSKSSVFARMITNSKKEELESVGEFSKVCSQIVLNCLYLARIGRPDILWSVNKLAPAVTKWTRACDRHLARLSSYTHHTNDYRQYCHMGNTAQHSGLGLFQDPDFAGDLGVSKSTSVRVLV